MKTPETQPEPHHASGNYTPNQARTHARSMGDTRRKIARVFDISEDRLNFSPLTKDRLTAGFANELRSNRWAERRDCWRNQPLDATETAALDKIAATAMLHYAEGFYLREQVRDCGRNHNLQGAEVDFFRKYPNGPNAIDNHLNHVFHATQAELEKATSGNMENALKMHGYLIQRCITHCKARGIQHAKFEPDCKEIKTPQACIDLIKSAGKDYADTLLEDYAKANKTGKLTHAARANRTKNDAASVSRY